MHEGGKKNRRQCRRTGRSWRNRPATRFGVQTILGLFGGRWCADVFSSGTYAASLGLLGSVSIPTSGIDGFPYDANPAVFPSCLEQSQTLAS